MARLLLKAKTMASLETDSKKRHRIRFIDGDGNRQAIYLGAVPLKHARQVLLYVESLVVAKIGNVQIGQDVARWVGDLQGKLRHRLAELGLIRDVETMSLPAFVERYITEHSAKESTKTVWRRCQRHLLACFRGQWQLSEVTKGDAVKFRAYLIRQGLAENTVKRTCGVAKQFFEYACELELINRNPFKQRAIVTTTTGSPKGRRAYVSEEDSRRVLAHCPNVQTRLLFALARWGGLRVPSEPMALRWDDVDFEAGKISVTVPKLAHIEGKAVRVIPIFPELRPYLEEAKAAATDARVITLTSENLRTAFCRFIRRAGLKPWPKLFHTLRASRQTDLEDRFPSHVVCEWIGNSERIAREHYLTTLDRHFDEATKTKE